MWGVRHVRNMRMREHSLSDVLPIYLWLTFLFTDTKYPDSNSHSGFYPMSRFVSGMAFAARVSDPAVSFIPTYFNRGIVQLHLLTTDSTNIFLPIFSFKMIVFSSSIFPGGLLIKTFDFRWAAPTWPSSTPWATSATSGQSLSRSGDLIVKPSL